MENVNKAAVAAWVIAILAAFASGLENGLMVSVGYASQWGLKAPAKIKDWAAPALTFAACLLAFSALHPPTWPVQEVWVTNYAKWALAALGVASAAGSTGGAAKTNSL